MRGEDSFSSDAIVRRPGSPPHARGRLSEEYKTAQKAGITPACAGKTRFNKYDVHICRDHPRMRGEDS